MKSILFISLCSLFLLSCKKQSFDDPIYQKFLGEWKNIDGNVTTYLRFEKDGKFGVYRAGYPSIELDVKSVETGKTLLIGGVYWTDYILKDNKRSFSFTSNITFDTVAVYLGTLNSDEDDMWFHQASRYVRN